MEIFTVWFVIPLAFILDLFLGDPEYLPHPIRWMGKAIIIIEPAFRKLPGHLFGAGIFFAVFLISLTWGITFLILKAAGIIDPLLKTIIEIVMIYFCVSARSLEQSALGVSKALTDCDLTEARQRVALIVGRDTQKLSSDGVSRAAIETVAENLVDGVISPLFFAAIGGAPLAMTYKMVNTLDSMIGYKNKTYAEFGKASARIDDFANFIPARISIVIISLAAQFLAGRGSRAWKTAQTEGRNHSSPNAGYPEAAFAGALGVRLNGPNFYQGRLVQKPYIGQKFGKPQHAHIKKACDLMFLSAALWTGVLSVVVLIFGA